VNAGAKKIYILTKGKLGANSPIKPEAFTVFTHDTTQLEQ